MFFWENKGIGEKSSLTKISQDKNRRKQSGSGQKEGNGFEREKIVK